MNPIQWIQKGEPDVQWDDLVIRLRNIETMTGNSGWRSEQQFTASHVLIVVINGQGRLSLDRFECRLREAGVYLCPPNETFEAAADHSEDLKLLLLRFEVYQDKEQRNQDIKSNDKMQWLALKGEIPIQPSESLVSMCMELCGYWQCPYGLERFRSQAIFQELIYRILKNRIHRLDAQQTSLESAKEYLENHYNENLTILQLAHIAQISPKYFVDLFKKTYGTSAIDYLTELRIKRAKQLMSQAHLRLRDIASQVGYQDEFYFSRKFKKRVGISPSMYMKKRRRKVAAYRPSDIGQLLALNIIPYAAPLHPKWTPFYYNRYRDDIEVHLSAYRRNLHWESNIETIRKAQPDIIICTDPISDGEKERLERMPSLLYAPESAKDWREQLVRIAEFLGERPEAMQFLQSYQEKVK